MSKKKSLGSSPIGFTSKDSTMGFIPDLGVSPSKNKVSESPSADIAEINRSQEKLADTPQESKTEKKIVSYNLEVDLINKVKSIASQKEMYYSSLVSMALKNWIAENS